MSLEFLINSNGGSIFSTREYIFKIKVAACNFQLHFKLQTFLRFLNFFNSITKFLRLLYLIQHYIVRKRGGVVYILIIFLHKHYFRQFHLSRHSFQLKKAPRVSFISHLHTISADCGNVLDIVLDKTRGYTCTCDIGSYFFTNIR